MTDMNREDFERIAKGIGYTLFSRFPDDPNYKSGRRGKYKDHMLEIAWEGWQEAALRYRDEHHCDCAHTCKFCRDEQEKGDGRPHR